MRRLYFDVSFTRTQTGNVGIIRTVRRLYQEFARLAPEHGLACVPVAFHTTGFRLAPPDWPARRAGALPPGPASPSQRLLHWITEGPIRKLVGQHFPLPLRYIMWMAYSWWDFNRLARDLPPVRFARGDVLFLPDASWNYSVRDAARQAREQGARVVTVVYDLIPLLQPEYGAPLSTRTFAKWLHRIIPESDGVLCISRAVKQDLQAYAAQQGFTLPPARDFRLGSDPLPGDGDGPVRPQIRAFMEQGPCFTAIGSIEPRKNYGFVLDAFERLWQRGVQARLLLVGRRTPQAAALLERVGAHPELGKRLLAVYDGSDEEVNYAYSGSRALIFASLAEGFGLPLVEARARGCRVIASDLPAFAELADEGVSTFARDSAAQFEALVLSHLGGLPAPARTIPFTWTDSARSCLSFIDSIQATTER